MIGAAALALLSAGFISWLKMQGDDLKHVHRRIDRLVRKVVKADSMQVLHPVSIARDSSTSSGADYSVLFQEVAALKLQNMMLVGELDALKKLMLEKSSMHSKFNHARILRGGEFEPRN